MTEPLVTILTPTPFPLPEPTSYSSTTTTLTDSDLSVSGKLLGSVIREDVAQISLAWNYLDAETWAQINQRFKDKSPTGNYINRVRFFDQTTGTWVSRNMYVSNRSAGLWRRSADGTVLGWQGCSFQFMEV